MAQRLDPLDELHALHDSRGQLEETIAKVRSFPEEVTRPCLVPLSRVAFLPGRFVHTNEFVVDVPELEEGDEDTTTGGGTVDLKDLTWTSHSQTAAVLQKRLDRVLARIRTIEDISAGKELEVLREVTIPSRPPVNAPVSKAQQVPSSQAQAQAQAQAQTQLATANATGNSPALPFYEIREFEDENGVVSSHELVDMTKPMSDHGAAGSAPPSPAPASGAGDNADLVEKALQDLQKKLQQGASSMMERQQAEDPEVAFAAELLHDMDVAPAPAAAKSGRGAQVLGDLDFLRVLEESEATGIPEVKEQRSVQQKHDVHRMPRAGGEGGWAAGFLGGGGGASKKSPSKKRAPAPKPAPKSAASPVPAPAASSSPFGGPILEKNI